MRASARGYVDRRPLVWTRNATHAKTSAAVGMNRARSEDSNVDFNNNLQSTWYHLIYCCRVRTQIFIGSASLVWKVALLDAAHHDDSVTDLGFTIGLAVVKFYIRTAKKNMMKVDATINCNMEVLPLLRYTYASNQYSFYFVKYLMLLRNYCTSHLLLFDCCVLCCCCCCNTWQETK